MALTIGDNFSYQGAKPLDTRLQYATIAEMKAKADSTLYDGIMAYCKADGKNYQWKSTNPVDETLGKWREFQSGGGGTSELANLDDVDLDDPADGEVLKYNATEEKWVNGEDIGGAGRAKSSAIAPVFDDTATYAAGDRVTYEDELYVFNKAHTGAWDAADVDKSDVDSEIPDKLTSQQMRDIKDAFSGMNKGAPLRMMHYSTEEQVVGTWIDGKPLYQKTIKIITTEAITDGKKYDTGITNGDVAFVKEGYFKDTYSNLYCALPCFQTVSSGILDGYLTFDVDLSDLKLKVRTNVSFSANPNRYFLVTIQYTKTTDTPQ